jgi:hypothetical protein
VRTRKLLALAAFLELVTGLALMIDPGMAAKLLTGNSLSGAGIVLSRVAGIALFALGLACWPGPAAHTGVWSKLRAILTYNVLVTVYLLCLATRGAWAGSLFWPAVAIHAVLTLLLAGAWFKERQSNETKP